MKEGVACRTRQICKVNEAATLQDGLRSPIEASRSMRCHHCRHVGLILFCLTWFLQCRQCRDIAPILEEVLLYSWFCSYMRAAADLTSRCVGNHAQPAGVSCLQAEPCPNVCL